MTSTPHTAMMPSETIPRERLNSSMRISFGYRPRVMEKATASRKIAPMKRQNSHGSVHEPSACADESAFSSSRNGTSAISGSTMVAARTTTSGNVSTVEYTSSASASDHAADAKQRRGEISAKYRLHRRPMTAVPAPVRTLPTSPRGVMAAWYVARIVTAVPTTTPIDAIAIVRNR